MVDAVCPRLTMMLLTEVYMPTDAYVYVSIPLMFPPAGLEFDGQIAHKKQFSRKIRFSR